MLEQTLAVYTATGDRTAESRALRRSRGELRRVALGQEDIMSKKAKMILALSVAAIAGVAGIFVFTWNGGSDEEASTSAAFEPGEPDIPADVLKQRGPRPTDTRLRDGARQVEDPQKALEMIDESLKRIDTELSAAAPEDRAALEHKKHLIEQMKERLDAR